MPAPTPSSQHPLTSPAPTVLEYRRVQPVIRQENDRAIRNAIGMFGVFFLFVVVFAAMLWQSSYPQDQHARDVDRWLDVEIQRRLFEINLRKGLASGTKPASPTPVHVHRSASALMTLADAVLVFFVLFSHRIVRRLDHVKRPLRLTPRRIWRAMLTLAGVQLLLALACVGLDAWRIFTPDFVFIGWFLAAVVLAELFSRFAAGVSFPEALQRMNLVKNRDEVLLRR